MNIAAKAKALAGKTIARVELNSFDDERGGKAHDPEFIFTDGSRLRFFVVETDHGDYGIDLLLCRKQRKAAR